MKRLKKLLRLFFIVLISLVAVVFVLLCFSVKPADRTPVQERPSYAKTMRRLDSLQLLVVPASKKGFEVGYAKVNLTPPFVTATAGYGKRLGKDFTGVHDSIYVRSFVIDNGTERIAIVSADLLIIPPAVTERLQHKLRETGFDLDHTFLGATHSHNSIGNWGTGATQFLYGSYRDTVVNFIVQKIAESVRLAAQNLLPTRMKAGTVPIPEAVKNRLSKEGKVDPLFRAIEFHRSDSSKLLMCSFTAHATCLYSRDLELSRDYPGRLVDTLEAQAYDFALFIAGAMGSHGYQTADHGWNCIEEMAGKISERFLSSRDQLQFVEDSSLMLVRIPLALGDPQVRITKDWAIRPWLFNTLFGNYPVSITALRIGDVVMLGTPCDFSGEFNRTLDSLAMQNGVKAIVTSFNGGYIGYATPVRYYDVNHFETRLMNWYGPGTGEYIRECIEKLIMALGNR